MPDAEADAEFDGIELLAGAAVISEAHIYTATEVGVESGAEAVIFSKTVADDGCSLLVDRLRFSVAVAAGNRAWSAIELAVQLLQSERQVFIAGELEIEALAQRNS